MAGDSAGGNLAAAVALHCRDAGRPLAGQLLIYPAVDLAAGLAVAGSNPPAPGTIRTNDGFFTGQDDWVERQYLGDDLSLATDPRVSPLRAAATRTWRPPSSASGTTTRCSTRTSPTPRCWRRRACPPCCANTPT